MSCVTDRSWSRGIMKAFFWRTAFTRNFTDPSLHIDKSGMAVYHTAFAYGERRLDAFDRSNRDEKKHHPNGWCYGGEGGICLHFRECENKGAAPSSRRRQLSTGQLYRKVQIPIIKKRPPERVVFLAEKEGFDPSIPFWGIHDFQSCALGQLRDFSKCAVFGQPRYSTTIR